MLVKQLAEHYDAPFVAVPGEGAADALQSALGGHVDATTQGTQHVQQVLSGNMKQVSTLIDKRAAFAPDVQALEESGLDPSAAIQRTPSSCCPRAWTRRSSPASRRRWTRR